MEKNVWKSVLSGSVAFVMLAGGANCVEFIDAKTPMLRAAVVESETSSQTYAIKTDAESGPLKFVDANGVEITEAHEGDLVYFEFDLDNDNNSAEAYRLDTGDKIDLQHLYGKKYYFEMPASEVYINQFYVRPRTVNLGENADKYLYTTYYFTPEEDGEYEFRADISADCSLTCEEIESEIEIPGHRTDLGQRCTLEAGKTYGFKLRNSKLWHRKTREQTGITILKTNVYGIESSCVNGWVSIGDPYDYDITDAVAGTTISFDIWPDEGYELDSFNVINLDTNESIETMEDEFSFRCFEMPAAPVSINVTYKKISETYEIKVGKIKHGKIEITYSSGEKSDDGKFESGADVTIKFIPDKGYKLKKAYLDSNVITPNNNKYFYTMPNGDVEIKATFEKTYKR